VPRGFFSFEEVSQGAGPAGKRERGMREALAAAKQHTKKKKKKTKNQKPKKPVRSMDGTQEETRGDEEGEEDEMGR